LELGRRVLTRATVLLDFEKNFVTFTQSGHPARSTAESGQRHRPHRHLRDEAKSFGVVKELYLTPGHPRRPACNPDGSLLKRAIASAVTTVSQLETVLSSDVYSRGDPAMPSGLYSATCTVKELKSTVSKGRTQTRAAAEAKGNASLLRRRRIELPLFYPAAALV
jgi:hypothetical protein